MQRKGLLEGQTILVTGGAGLIGSAIVKEAAKQGANVIVSDISRKTRKDKTEEKHEVLGQINYLEADITKENEVRDLIRKIEEDYGKISGVIHSAYPRSNNWGKEFEHLSLESLSTDLSYQLGSAIILSKYAIQHFLDYGGGNLIHISSIQGISAPKFEHYEGTGMTSPIEYSAIKAGIISITKWLAKKYFNKNIRVNCVSPGGIKDKQEELFLDQYRNSCSNIGMLEPKHVASTVIYLMTKDAFAINGQNIIIDDGWSL